MENINIASKMIFKNCFMSNLDLRDAYYLVPIHEKSRKFLRFVFKNETFEFTCLPFGLSLSPFLFTKLMKPIINYLRNEGWISCIYLDDFLLIGRNAVECTNNIKATISLLERLGFLINYDKSELVPNTRCNFLGFIIDSKLLQIEPTKEKK